MREPTATRLVRETYAKWSADDGWLYAAAMAAFGALALAPLLVIALRIAEAVGGERTVLHGLALVIDPIVGHGGVRALSGTEGLNGRPAGIVTVVLSVLVALFAGSRLFYALQRALHAMWDTPVRRGATVLTTVASFLAAAVLAVCAIGATTAVIFGSAAASIAAHAFGAHGVAAAMLIRIVIVLCGSLVLAPVVAALFRWLPGAALHWSDVWIGALTTTTGFALAQFAIGTYLAYVNLPWTYGSAASVMLILLWLYYSSYLFLLGAEFTVVYAREVGSLRGRRAPAARNIADAARL
ncbi:MAG TPA: YhjD/YihY/BrkB family envelope integrity protein [Candidatus Baltobacteraceae bacterium]|nr:YhjD/YihY/BrkB family envelope integrity protein [Candidatus Baltobacteraceae bacterium]